MLPRLSLMCVCFTGAESFTPIPFSCYSSESLLKCIFTSDRVILTVLLLCCMPYGLSLMRSMCMFARSKPFVINFTRASSVLTYILHKFLIFCAPLSFSIGLARRLDSPDGHRGHGVNVVHCGTDPACS